MSEYPEDIVKTVELLWIETLRGEAPIKEIISKALLSERERCAVIADRHAQESAENIRKKHAIIDLAVLEAARMEASAIALCIRNPRVYLPSPPIPHNPTEG